MRKRRRFRPEFRSKLGLEVLAGADHQLKRVATTASALRRGRASRPIRVPSRFQTFRRPYAGMVPFADLGPGLVVCLYGQWQGDGTDDTEATTMLPLSRLRGDGISLERFSPLLRDEHNILPFVVLSHGRLVSCYPVAPALLVVPLMEPQIAFLDSRQPGWDLHPGRAMQACRRMAKWSVSVLMALAAVTLHRFLLRLGLYRGALPAVVAAFLGSDLWTHASQALWQHGPAALSLIAALALLHPGPVSRWRFVLAGMATTLDRRAPAGFDPRGDDRRVGCPVAASTPVLVPACARCRSRVAARLQLLVLRVDRRRPGAARANCTPGSMASTARGRAA